MVRIRVFQGKDTGKLGVKNESLHSLGQVGDSPAPTTSIHSALTGV